MQTHSATDLRMPSLSRRYRRRCALERHADDAHAQIVTEVVDDLPCAVPIADAELEVIEGYLAYELDTVLSADLPAPPAIDNQTQALTGVE